MKITVKQLKQMIKEQVEEGSKKNQYKGTVVESYPHQLQALLLSLYDEDLLEFSDDAAAVLNGKGLWVPCESLIKIIKRLGGK